MPKTTEPAERKSDMKEVLVSLSTLTAAINALTTLVNVHIATDLQYRTMVTMHDEKIRGNSEPSYDAKIDSLNQRMKMIFSIGAAIWGLCAIGIGWLIVKLFNDYVTLFSLLPH